MKSARGCFGLPLLLLACIQSAQGGSATEISPANCHSAPANVRSTDGARDEATCQEAREAMHSGASEFAAGRMDKAAVAWRRAMTIFQNCGASGEFCDAAQNLAGAYQSLGQAKPALATLQAALAEAKRIGDGPRTLSLLAALGAASIYTTDAMLAEPCLLEALSMARDSSNAAAQAN